MCFPAQAHARSHAVELRVQSGTRSLQCDMARVEKTDTHRHVCGGGGSALTKQLSVLPLSEKHVSHTCLTVSSSTRVFHTRLSPQQVSASECTCARAGASCHRHVKSCHRRTRSEHVTSCHHQIRSSQIMRRHVTQHRRHVKSRLVMSCGHEEPSRRTREIHPYRVVPRMYVKKCFNLP